MRRNEFHKFFRCCAGVLPLFMAVSGEADMLRQHNLETLVSEAAIIFSGTCIRASAGAAYFAETGLLGFTEYEFAVDEWAKGASDGRRTVTFRQPRALQEQPLFDVLRRHGRAGAGTLLMAPEYAEGQKYVLFLHEGNEWGLTCPVGSVQGAFTLVEEKDGPVPVNGIDNRGLFRGMESDSPFAAMSPANSFDSAVAAGGRFPLGSFLSVVRNLAGRSHTR